LITSGIRLGTPACNTRGFSTNEFKIVGNLIDQVLKGLINNKSSEVEKEVQEKVKKLCANFPIYKF
jgi:glycine hydroxymethyltransferase